MSIIRVDLGKQKGNIKPMNCVNNGPAGSRIRQTGNFPFYEKLKIPYARLHDSAFYQGNYGGEFSVDVHRIFRDFNADENDEKSYIFEPTDNYLQDIESVGTKIFYRLGAAIEHDYKFGTKPPADFKKWARICEHIIRHYTEGWANGFHMNIEYWEIWNEHECWGPNGIRPTWQGTDEQFNDFYCTVAIYLKEKFPHLKIGGPAFATIVHYAQVDSFLTEVKKRNAPLDFLSFHIYTDVMEKWEQRVNIAVEYLKKYDLQHIELHLNEWNYVRTFVGEDWIYSLKTEKNDKGAAFVAAIMLKSQKLPLDMLMYYDARPCAMNGLFSEYHQPLKPYYSFLAFSELAELKQEIETIDEGDLYSVAACNGEEAAIMISRFDNNDELASDDVSVEFSNVKLGECVKLEYYLLDADNDLELKREEYFTSNRFNIKIKMENQTVYLIKIKKYKDKGNDYEESR